MSDFVPEDVATIEINPRRETVISIPLINE
jgi:hypothetical protein